MPAAQPGLTLLYTTWPDPEGPAKAARQLLDERLIACANVLGASGSIYRWEGKVEEATEIIALFKTAPERAVAASARIAELHPYAEPCVIALQADADASAPGFLAWAAESVRLTA